jgi:hypothetical protein
MVYREWREKHRAPTEVNHKISCAAKDLISDKSLKSQDNMC